VGLHKPEFKILPVFPYKGLEDHAGKQGQKGGHGAEPAHNQGGIAGDKAGLEVFRKNREKEQAGQRR